MSETEILNQAHQFGITASTDAFAAFAETHRCVTTTRNSRRNAGKVDLLKMLRAYAEGRRAALAGE